MNNNKGRNRTSTRLARKNKTGEKLDNDLCENIVSLGHNGQPIDEIDMLFDGMRSKMYPICAPLNKKGYAHNLAEIPSLQPGEESLTNGDSEATTESTVSPRKHSKRCNANSLIESRNKFRQLLNGIQSKRPYSNGAFKSDSQFDGYELKSRRVKYDPRPRSRREIIESRESANRTNTEYYVKLLEKTIDLSPYCKLSPNQSFSLYTLSRQWARTNYGLPDNFRSKRQHPPPPFKEGWEYDGPYSDRPEDVVHLPKPEPLPRDQNGNPICLRIPAFVREFKSSDRHLDTSKINSMQDLTSAQTLALSLPHWKKVKQEFLKAARQNESRYRHSFAVLKAIFEKSTGDKEVQKYKYPPYESDTFSQPVNNNNKEHRDRDKDHGDQTIITNSERESTDVFLEELLDVTLKEEPMAIGD